MAKNAKEAARDALAPWVATGSRRQQLDGAPPTARNASNSANLTAIRA
jgi:hypothetical protein